MPSDAFSALNRKVKMTPNKYETIFICPAELPQEKIDATFEKVKSIITRAEGKISFTESWGRRRLSYQIKHNREGYYLYLVFTAPPQVPALLTHHFRVSDTILRGLTVRMDERYADKAQAQTTPAGPESETVTPIVTTAPGPVEGAGN